MIWTAEIRSNTSRYVSQVKVEFTTSGRDGTIMDTDFSFASGLPPGGTASVKGYATYFGQESDARIRVVP